MGKLQLLDIRFDNPMNVFYAGSNITGYVTIVLNEAMKLRAVKLRVSGRARTHWTEIEYHHHNNTNSSHSTTQSETVHYEAETAYLTFDVNLWTGPSGSDSYLPAGNHNFQFQFQIPPHCPTSFEGQNGCIRYFMQAIMDRPWRFDHTAKQAFTVIGLVDLNRDMQAMCAVQNTGAKTIGCLCCEDGNVALTITLPQGGYVPGEFLPVTAKITNGSSKPIEAIVVELIQTATFSAKRRWSASIHYASSGWHKRTSRQTVASMRKQESEVAMPPGETVTHQFTGFRVPSIPPSLLTCEIINVCYEVNVKLVLSGMSTNLNVGVPISIGTIPLRQHFAQKGMIGFAQPPYQGQPSALPSAPPMGAIGQEYPDLPPPSYEESVLGRTNIREECDTDYTRGQLDYAPRYPMYNIGFVQPQPQPQMPAAPTIACQEKAAN